MAASPDTSTPAGRATESVAVTALLTAFAAALPQIEAAPNGGIIAFVAALVVIAVVAVIKFFGSPDRNKANTLALAQAVQQPAPWISTPPSDSPSVAMLKTQVAALLKDVSALQDSHDVLSSQTTAAQQAADAARETASGTLSGIQAVNGTASDAALKAERAGETAQTAAQSAQNAADVAATLRSNIASLQSSLNAASDGLQQHTAQIKKLESQVLDVQNDHNKLVNALSPSAFSQGG